MNNKLVNIWLVFFCGLLFMPLAQAEWVDISPSVEITKSAKAFDRVKRVLFSYVTIKNTSGVPIEGPLHLKIIDPSIPVINADGISTDFKSYIEIDNVINDGEEKTVRVNFQLARTLLSFETILSKEDYIVKLRDGMAYNPLSSDRLILNPEEGRAYVDGTFIIFFKPLTPLEKINEIASSVGGAVNGYSLATDMFQIVIAEKGLNIEELKGIRDSLKNHTEVLSVSLDTLIENKAISFESPTDGFNASYTDEAKIDDSTGNTFTYNWDFGDEEDSIWDSSAKPAGLNAHLEVIDIVKAWEKLTADGKSLGGQDIWIGIIDSKLAEGHPDLDIDQYYCNKKIALPSFDTIKSIPSSIVDISDYFLFDGPLCNGSYQSGSEHGTHVTGIIGADYNNKIGTTGILPNKKIVFLWKSYPSSGFFLKMFQENLAYYGVKIINISQGLPVQTFWVYKSLEFPKKCAWVESVMDNGDPVFEMSDATSINPFAEDICEETDARINIADQIIEGNASLEILNDLIENYKDEITKENIFYERLFSSYPDLLIVQAAGNENQDASANGFACSVSNHTLKQNILCIGGLGSMNLSLANRTLNVRYGNQGLFEFATSRGNIESNTGKNISAVAPHFVWSTLPDNGSNRHYGTLKGTSMAAPIVTGVAGLIWNAYPELTAHKVRQAIIEGHNGAVSDPLDNELPVVNAYQALLCAEKLDNGAETCLPLSNGLIAHYSFDKETAADDSGNGYDGTEQNGVVYVDGVNGKAASFDGINDYISLPNEMDTLKTNTAKSVFAWVKIPAGVSSAECGGWGYLRSVVDNSPGGHWRYLGIHIRDGVYKAASGIQKYQTYIEGDTLSPDTWHLIGFTWSPDSPLKVYTDDNAPAVSSQTLSSWDTADGSTFIGRQYSNPCGHYFKGAITDVRIYDRALPKTEVELLYQLGHGG